MNLQEQISRIKSVMGVINESKQIGILYHYTDMEAMIMIISGNKLMGHKKSENKYAISFTRNKNFKSQVRDLGKNLNCRLSVDGNRLSEKFRIVPYASGEYRHPLTQEQEERLIMKKKFLENIDEYILAYDFYLDEIFNYDYYWLVTLKDFYDFFISTDIYNPKFGFYLNGELISKDDVIPWIKNEITVIHSNKFGTKPKYL
jgi:hypothetical protein